LQSSSPPINWGADALCKTQKLRASRQGGLFLNKIMMNTTLVYSFGQVIYEASSKKKPQKTQQRSKDPEENQIIEEYEGECEQCENNKPQKTCSVCPA
jgi:hypothetical protein